MSQRIRPRHSSKIAPRRDTHNPARKTKNQKWSLDPASLPPNYLAPTDSISVHVSPVSTVIEDLPMRALRSIGGRVLLRVQDDVAANSATTLKQNRAPSGHSQSSPENEEPEMVPVAGVRVTAGPSTATTDK